MRDGTPKRRAVLEQLSQLGRAASITELAEVLNMKRITVYCVCLALREDGEVVRSKRRHASGRSYEDVFAITPDDYECLGLVQQAIAALPDLAKVWPRHEIQQEHP